MTIYSPESGFNNNWCYLCECEHEDAGPCGMLDIGLTRYYEPENDNDRP